VPSANVPFARFPWAIDVIVSNIIPPTVSWPVNIVISNIKPAAIARPINVLVPNVVFSAHCEWFRLLSRAAPSLIVPSKTGFANIPAVIQRMSCP
jgi:hypothetical protein